MKLDVLTDISVSQVTGRLLRINLEREKVLVHVHIQKPEHMHEALIGKLYIVATGVFERKKTKWERDLYDEATRH